MIAWVSLVLLFLLPTIDLGLRLLGFSALGALAADGMFFLGLVFGLPRMLHWSHTPWRRLLLWALASLSVAMAWFALRVSSFEFSPFGENIYDLHYIASLLSASTLPAQELWTPGIALNHYYYLGFYIVAFYGRLLCLDAGQAYAMFLVLVPVVVFANFWAVIPGGMLARTLTALTATFPSTGLSALISLRLVTVPEHLRAMAHVRLTEWSDLAASGGPAAWAIDGRAYPIEGLTHLLGWLGDLHPPVFGLLLLSLVLCAIYVDRAGDTTRAGAMAAGLAVPLSFAINPWTLPCFAAVAVYAALNRRQLRDVFALGLAALFGAAALWPMLDHLDLPTATVQLRWLAAEHRSSLPIFLTIWGPLIAVSVWLAVGGGRWVLPALFAAMVVGLEVVLLDDPYADRYERFNGVLKVASFALAGWTAAVMLEAAHTGRRALLILIMLPLLALSLMQLVDVLRPRVQGSWAERNWTVQTQRMLPGDDLRALYASLREQCPGLTLERMNAQAYTRNPVVSTALAWPTLSGWPSHLAQIGALSDAAGQRQRQAQAWFETADPQALHTEQIGYVLIDRSLNWDLAEITRRAAALAPDYQFKRVEVAGEGPVVGYFVSTGACASRER
ncbi:hypothetical protein E4T66_06890 [Sinimarinibacterium sp. CAU 1509]|uniref:DUF2298 domain-containing protein n=1 Tax=Sinimarinibacterium sp. CAU 1509 TaxID=2562283 RepID=UPI0010AD93BE|nr:hypothetical protein [Sinimarinibacterium sp. CAU 1509]TJY61964.1 hypothetical protein E4T66_06890 [Sinimarinibacterium sp. CAU 1509]